MHVATVPYGHGDPHVLAAPTMLIRLIPRLAVACPEPALHTEAAERVLRRRCNKVHGASAATIAALRTTSLDELLTAEAQRASTAIASLNINVARYRSLVSILFYRTL